MIKVYSGCLRSIFEVKEATKSTHSYEDTEDCSFDLIYSDVVVNSCQIEFVKCYENGGNDYLVVMKQIEENKYYMIDIIQFDEECVNQYQRIPSIEFLKSEWEFPELFLDTENIYTAKKTLTHKSDFPYRDVRFNWNVQEMVFLQRTRYEQPLKLQIVKISAFLDHDSLKHRARLACLTWYNKEYLINHLPKCLQKYLGIV
uniref:Uncharacterized protein n=1 Tax=Clytia hemisphaerica TaxID=252671 RepID=A0A7M5XI77_9CNID